jgi:hypothetical protein
MDDQIFDEKTREELPVDFSQSNTARKKFTNPKVIIPVVVVLLLIAGIGWYFLSRPTNNTPTSTNVLLFVKGPSQLTSGNEGEYHIIYRNGENADLVNVSLEILYPSGFTFKSATPAAISSAGQKFNLPLVKPGQDGDVIIRGKLSGSTNEDKQITAKLHYSLSNFNSVFAVEQSIHTTILPPNLTMDISGPINVVNGQDSTFVVNFTNVTTQDFANLGVQLTYPEGFSFTSSNPKTYSGQNYWKIDKLASNSSGSISVVGSFAGDSSQGKLVIAAFGQIINNTFAPQINATATFVIIPSSLSLALSAQPNSYVNLGDTINYKLKYSNQGTIGLSNLVITVNLDSPVLDFSRLSNSNAIVTGHQITWKAATLPGLSGLSPNEKGEINFSVPVKQTLTTNLKSQAIVAQANITANEMPTPTRAADVALKLISKLGLNVSGDYVSGTVPMQVGKSTLFNMNFLLTNLSNDLSDVQVVASLPLPVSAWKNVIVPDSEKTRLTYDPSSGKITWRLDTLPAFTGKFSPALTVSFQLEVTPTESDHGKPINLLSNIQAGGMDTFVNQTIQTEVINSLSTANLDDNVLDTKGTTVQ